MEGPTPSAPDPRAWWRRLHPEREQRRELLAHALSIVDDYLERLPRTRPHPDPSANVEELLAELDLEEGGPPERAVSIASELLDEAGFHAGSPGYFGLLTPAACLPGILGSVLASAYNPQLSAASHAPGATRAEHRVVGFLAELLGGAELTSGLLTSGGTEANHVAVLLALSAAEVGWREGLPGGTRPIAIYSGEHVHASLDRAALCAGLGARSVVRLPGDSSERGWARDLARRIRTDRRAGIAPLMIVGTAGGTATGSIDRLSLLGAVARDEGLHYHVDAAWGGALAFSPRLRFHLDGIELAHSVTFDPHKWLNVPLGCGALLVRSASQLRDAFTYEVDYLADVSASDGDLWTMGIPFSRSFLGARLLVALAVVGRTGYQAFVEHHVRLGESLRHSLERRDWRVLNRTPLPVVCARSDRLEDRPDRDRLYHLLVTRELPRAGAWVSRVTLDGATSLRIGINSAFTEERHIAALVDALDEAVERLVAEA